MKKNKLMTWEKIFGEKFFKISTKTFNFFWLNGPPPEIFKKLLIKNEKISKLYFSFSY